MSGDRRRLKRFILRVGLFAGVLGMFLAGLPHPAFARLSGLDNIPTADILQARSSLLQVWSAFGKDRTSQFALGLRYGISSRVEATVDNGRILPSPRGDTLLAAKYRLSAAGEPVSYAVGVSDVGAGKENPFLVASRGFKGFRGHLGFEAQKDNEGFSLALTARCRGSRSSARIWCK